MYFQFRKYAVPFLLCRRVLEVEDEVSETAVEPLNRVSPSWMPASVHEKRVSFCYTPLINPRAMQKHQNKYTMRVIQRKFYSLMIDRK